MVKPNAADFVRDNTALTPPPLVPEVALYLATEITPIWEATEAILETHGLPPPFWAFAWPGGQAIARYILDRPETVAGKRVLDFACGGGIAAIACDRAGAESVLANDIDGYALTAARLNAEHNAATFERSGDNLVGADGNWDIILAGDVCYERPMADDIMDWLRRCAGSGQTVLMGDPGRKFLPSDRLVSLAEYEVPVPTELEDRPIRQTVVWRVLP